MPNETNDIELAYLQRGLEIDKHALDRCLIEQPSNFFKAAEAYAEAVNLRDGLKDELKELEAQVYLECQQKGGANGKALTQNTLESMVDADVEVVEKRKQLRIAAKDVEVLSGMKEAYSERNYVLKALCDLEIAGFYQTSSVNAGNARSVQEASINERRREVYKPVPLPPKSNRVHMVEKENA